MLFPKIDGYVCLTCGEAIENPSVETGHLRCPHGHFVDGVKSGPLWANGVNAHFMALVPLALVAMLLRGNWMSWVVLSVFVVWGAYMFVLGVLLPREQAAIKTVAAQFMVAAVARVGAAVAVGLYVWFVLRHGNWLF